MFDQIQQDGDYKLNKINLVKSIFEIPGIGFQPKGNLSLRIDVESEKNDKISLLRSSLTIDVVDDHPENEKKLALTVSMVAEFQILRDNSQLNLDYFGNVNAPAIIYPYIRQHIRALTLEAGFTQPIILPVLNFVKFYEGSKQETKY